MRHRHPLPTIWLMTDERMPDLWAALNRLPARSGIIFRHHSLAARARRQLFDQVRGYARRHNHVILLAAAPALARAWGADGAHHRSLRVSRGLRSVAVHTGAERITALRARADLILISPVFVTRSHPGAAPLGRLGLLRLARSSLPRAIALGGMTAARFNRLRALNLYGWAGIDAF
jgi:thiamine-phosphate pyrophosphorylase